MVGNREKAAPPMSFAGLLAIGLTSAAVVGEDEHHGKSAKHAADGKPSFLVQVPVVGKFRGKHEKCSKEEKRHQSGHYRQGPGERVAHFTFECNKG